MSTATAAQGLEGRELEIILHDGLKVHVRPIGSGDEGELQAFLAELSPESRWLRFFTGAANVPAAARWAVDAPARDALGLLAHEDCRGRIVAHASCEPIDDEQAEVAFEVAERFRERGLATALLAELADSARQAGLARLVAEVLPENWRMLEVFQDSGLPMQTTESEGIVTVTLDLEGAA